MDTKCFHINTAVRTIPDSGPPSRTYSLEAFRRVGMGPDAGNRRIPLILFLVSFACYAYFMQVPGWNQSSRMALIMSVVNRHQLTIDAYQGLTGDKAYYKGHYYSDKAIGTAVLGVPVYAAIRQVQRLDHYPKLRGDIRYSLYLVSIGVVALPSAILCVLFYYLALLLSRRRLWAVALALCYSFGTLAFPFSTVLFEHQDAAAFGFAAFVALVKARLASSSPRWLLLAGTLTGVAVLMEFPAALMAIALFVYAASFARPLRRLGFFALGGVPWALLMFGYNLVTLGSPLRFAYQYEWNTAFQAMHSGFFGITAPQWSALVEILVGPRGLLVQSPFLLLLPLGVWAMGRAEGWRRECALCVGLGLVFVLYNAAYYLPIGGDSPGARFLVAVIPFLVVPLAFLPALPRLYAALAQSALVLAGAYSVALYALICITNPLAPEGIDAPVSAYWLPLYRHGSLMMNAGTIRFGLWGMASLAPLGYFLLCASGALVAASSGRTRRNTLLHVAGMVLLVVGYLAVAFPLDLLHPAAVPSLFAR